MIPGEKRLRDSLPVKYRRPGVLRVFQKTILERLLPSALLPKSTFREAGDRIQKNHSRKFTPGQDIVTDRNQFIHIVINPGIKTLIMTTDQNQMLAGRQPAGIFLLINMTDRRQKNRMMIQLRMTHLGKFKRIQHRLAAKNHTRPTPIRRIINMPETPTRKMIPGGTPFAARRLAKL